MLIDGAVYMRYNLTNDYNFKMMGYKCNVNVTEKLDLIFQQFICKNLILQALFG